MQRVRLFVGKVPCWARARTHIRRRRATSVCSVGGPEFQRRPQPARLDGPCLPARVARFLSRQKFDSYSCLMAPVGIRSIAGNIHRTQPLLFGLRFEYITPRTRQRKSNRISVNRPAVARRPTRLRCCSSARHLSAYSYSRVPPLRSK